MPINWRSRIFWKKNLIFPNLGKKCPKLPKNEVFAVLTKIYFIDVHFLLFTMEVLMVLYHSEKTTCLGKIWFWSYGPKCSRPIRLQESLIIYSSRRGYSHSLIFCMQVESMEGRGWVQHFGLVMPRLARHVQICPIFPNGVFADLTKI